MMIIGVVLLILAALLLVVGTLATLRKLPGNSVIGLRVEEVRKSKDVWDAAHAVAGPVWFLGGAALLFGGVTALRGIWIIPLVSFIVAVLAVSVGANLGARASVVATKPKVDLNALRSAAAKSDS